MSSALKLEAVEDDPFAAPAPATGVRAMPALEPVESDPFAAPQTTTPAPPPASSPISIVPELGTPAVIEPPVQGEAQPAPEPQPLNQFERGVMTGVVGAKQMGVAASTIPSYAALREYSRVRGLFDQIDADGYRPGAPRLDDRFGDTLARRYFTQPGERAALRERLDTNTLSAQGTRDELLQAWKAYEEEIKQYEGRTPNFTDIRDAKGFGDWFAYNTGQSLPYMAITALTSLTGGVVAGAGGAAGGLLASGYGIGVGDIQSGLIEKGQGEQYGNAMVGAVPYAALDFLGPVGRAFRTISGNTLRDVATSYFRRLGREIPENAVEEFINEAGQEIVKDAAVTNATGEAMLTDEALVRWFNAGMAGAAGGAAMAPASAIPGPTRAQQVAQANQQGQRPAAGGVASSQMAQQPAPAAQPAEVSPILQPEPAQAPAPPPGRDALAASLADPRSLAEVEAARQAEATAAAQATTDRYGLPAAGPVTVRFPDGEEVQGEVIGAVEQDGQGYARIRAADGEVYLLSKDDADIAVTEGSGRRDDPVKVKQAADVAAAAQQANQDPTDAQKEAGNYQKGHLKLQGLDISIENPAGSTRSGTAPDGSAWSVQMPTHYGYIKRTTGADGDQVDVYLGPNPDSDWVWIVDQIDPDTGKFDEHKVMLGYSLGQQAGQHYLAAFSDGRGRERAGAETRMTMAEFKDWLRDGDAAKPLAYVEPASIEPNIVNELQAELPPLPATTLQPIDTDPFAAEAAPPAPAVTAASTGAAEPQPAATPMVEPAGAPDEVPEWFTALTPAGREQALVASGITKGRAQQAAKMNWQNLPAALRKRMETGLVNTEIVQWERDWWGSLSIDERKKVIHRAGLGGVLSPNTPWSRIGRKNATELLLQNKDYGPSLNAIVGGGVRDSQETAAGRLPVEDARERQRRENVAKMEAWQVEAAQTITEPVEGDPFAGQPISDTVLAEENQDAGRIEPLDGTSDQTLEAAPAEPVRAPESQREAGERGARGSGDDAPGDAGNADGRGDAGRGMAGDAGTVSVPADGTDERPERGTDTAERGPQRQPRDGRTRPERGLTQAEPQPEQDTGAAITRAINDPESQGAGKNEVPGHIAPVATNYVITEKDRLGEGGQAEKFRDNLAAIRLLKQLEAEGRRANAEEQAVLVRYVGWGGIKSAFPKGGGVYNKGWEAKGRELRDLLTDDEYSAAMRSVLDAHYTAPEVVKAIHSIIGRLGYRGGKLLEPSMGTGNFFGLMPLDLRSQTEITGVELDRITGGIAKQLYQKFNILAPMGFQEAPLADSYFDVAVGNPPFGIQRVPGAKEKDIKTFSIHNYFFARTINKLRPGGIMAMVVTHRFLDKPGEAQRQYIADRAKFIGAIRLPNTAFQQNALTEVTTDIVILQKLAQGEKAGGAAWTQVGEVNDPLGGDPMPLNQYFIDNPDMMLGRMERSGTMRQANEPTLAPDGRNLSQAFAEAIARLPADIFTASSTVSSTADMVKATAELSEAAADYDIGAFYLDGGKLQRREESPDGTARAVTISPATQWTEKQTLGEARYERLMGMVEVRDAARRLLRLEAGNANEGQLSRARKALNHTYDKFTARHGFLSDRSNEGLFKDDPDAPLLLALEKNYDAGISADRAKKLGVKARKSSAEKMAIFKQRVITQYEPVTKADTPKDALVVSLADLGRVDIGHMAKLTGKPESDIVKSLHDDLAEPLIFRDPETNTWETASSYLSGNVKAKAKAAEIAGLDKNVEALRAVFPPDKKAGEIKVRLGAPWVAGRYYADFAKHLFGDGTRASVTYIPVTGGYSSSIKAGNDTKADVTWGTDRMDGAEILDRILNAKELTVYDKVREADGERRVVNKDATLAVQEKAEAIRQEFDDWIMRDADRRAALTDYFNENINTTIAPKFDGSHLTLPGKVPDSIIKFRRHQKNATWRGIQQRTVLYDHVVGAGKTFTVVAAAMELRRMGLSKKPMVVVPNHLVEQWAADFYRLYPGAKILTMSKKDFEARNRRRMLSRIATGDWDAVVIAHSSFGFIRVNPMIEVAFIEKQIDEIQASIDILRQEEGKGNRKVADLVRSKERMTAKLKELADKPKDDILTFDELGVDQVFVDEAHEFKNLYFTTGRRGMLGLGNPQGSKKAFDLFIKTQWLLDKQDGRGVIFATGTPVSNSLTEMYTVQRYLGLRALERLNILSFDAWLNTFGVDATDYELDGSGVKLKQVSRLRRLTNMNQLMAMYQQYADSVTIDQIKQAYREENPGKEFPIPKVKGGQRQNVIVPRSADQSAFFAEIVERAQNIKPGGKDNMLAITTDARKAALDMRLISTGYGDTGAGKSDEAVSNIIRIWRKWEADRGTQLVFLDLSIPLSASKREGKALRDRMAKVNEARARVQRLQDRGAPAGEVEAAMLDLSELEEAVAKDYSPDDLAAISAAESGFSVYDDMKAKLVRAGVPEKQIAFIHDYGTDEKKADLFEQVNDGRVRILFGSTPKMGAGTNVQRRAVGLHHIDCPWRPSDIEQREGRVIRQGNELLEKYGKDFEVEIYAYSTEQTYDARMWQSQELKLIGIEGLRNHNGADEMEEVAAAAASAAEMKAAATGNPLILEEVKLADDIRKLEAQQRNHRKSQYELEDQRDRLNRTLDDLPPRLEAMDADAASARAYLADPHADEPLSGTVAGTTYHSFDEARAAATAAVNEQTGGDTKARYSIEVSGQTLTSQDAIAEALSERWGDPAAFRATIGRKTFIRRAPFARAIGDALSRSGSATGSIGGMKFSVTVNRDTWHGKPNVETTLEGRTVLSDISTADRDDKAEALGRLAVRDIRELLESMTRQPTEARHRIAKAKKELPEIESQVGKPWGKEEELARKKSRQTEIRRVLASDGNAPAPASQSAAKPDDEVPFQRAEFTRTGVRLIGDVVKMLREEMDRLGLNGVGLETPARIAENDSIQGAYLRRVIFVALDTSVDPLGTVRHEAIHAMYRLGMFRASEWKSLETMAKERWIDQYNIRQRWSGASEMQMVEEAIAEAFADYMRGKYNPGGIVRRAFSTMKRLLARIREFFAGEGVVSWEQVFEAAARGDIGKRDPGGKPSADDQAAATTALRQYVDGTAAAFQRSQNIPTPPTNPPVSPKANMDRGREAIRRLLGSRNPENEPQYHAMYRRGLGWISFLWEAGPNGDLGLAHIIESRSDRAKNDAYGNRTLTGADMVRFLESIPEIVQLGTLGRWYAEGDRLSRNIHSPNGTVVLRPLPGQDGNLTWVATAFPGRGKEMPVNGRPLSEQQAQAIIDKMIADAAARGKRPSGDTAATRRGLQARDRSEPRRDQAAPLPKEDISARAGSGEAGNLNPGPLKGKGDDDPAFQVAPHETELRAAEASDEFDTKKVSGVDSLLVDDVNWFKRAVLHPRMIAAMEKAFVPVYRAAVRMTERRDQRAAELTTMAKPYFDLAPEKRVKVDAALELGRLQGVSRKTITAISNDDSHEATLSRPGDTITLDADQQAAFAAVRSAMDLALDEFKAQIVRDWDLDPAVVKSSRDVMHLITDDMPAEERRSLENLSRILREIEQARRSGYVPFTRWGQVGITVKVDGDVMATTGEVAENTIHFEKVELTDIPAALRRSFGRKAKRQEAHKLMNLPEVKARYDALKARFPKGRIRVFQVGVAGPLEDGVKMSDLDMLAEVAQLKDESWTNVRAALSKAIQSTGFRKHFFGARNVPGYSTDFERAIADYIIGISGYLARREFQPIFDRAISSIPDTQPKLREYSQKYRDYVNTPQEEFQNLRQFNFVWYLAGSFATAVVNLSQVPLITAPYLAQFVSAGRAGAELSRAAVDAMKMATSARGTDMFDPSRAPADMRADFQQAWDEGFFVPLNTWEVMGASQNRSKKLRGLSKKTRLAVDIVALMFSAAERFNRIVTYIAAHRIGRMDGVKGRIKRTLGPNNPLARSDELLRGFNPSKFAGWVIDETHYRMGKVNRPTVMRSAGAAILQFKGFMMQTLELQYRMAVQNGPSGMKALGLVMLVLLFTAGFWGLPFADDLTDLIEAFIRKFWKVDKDLRTGFREAVVELTGSPLLAEGLAKGLPRAVGLEVSARMGLGNIVPNDIDDGLGVPFDLFIGRIAQASEYAGRGQWELMVGEMMPNFIRNPIHATSWAVSGVRSQATGKTVIPPEGVTAGDVAAKTLGFTPSRVANIREAEFAQQRAGRASADQKREFYYRLARAGAAAERAAVKGDAEAHRKALEESADIYRDLAEFNQDRPAHELVKIDKKTLQARIQEELIGAEARDKRAPKLSRGRREEIEGAYGVKK